MRLWKVPESRWLPSSCPETPSSGDELWTNVEGRWSFASRLCAACPAAAVSQAPLRKPTYTCKIKCVIFISVKKNRCNTTIGPRGCCDCFWCTLVFPIWYVVGSRPIFFPSSAAMSSLQAVALLGNRTLNWSTNSCRHKKKKKTRKMKTWWEDFYVCLTSEQKKKNPVRHAVICDFCSSSTCMFLCILWCDICK